MGLPADYDTVTVRGTYVYRDGSIPKGAVRFTTKVFAQSPATHTNVVPVEIVARLDEAGQFSVPVPVTDDPDIVPNGVGTYTVHEDFDRGGGRKFQLPVPLSAQAAGIDLSDVAVGTPPASPDPPVWATLEAVTALQGQLVDQTELAALVVDAQTAAGSASDSAEAAVATVGNKVDKDTQVIDVHDYGAVGDGTTDDTAAIQAAITAATDGAKVLLRPGRTYLQAGPITIAKPLTLSGYGATITNATLNIVQIMVTSGDVRLEGFELVGPGGGDTVYDALAGGIHIVGPESLQATPDFDNTIDRIALVDLRIRDMRRIGVYAEYVRDITIQRCTIERCVFASVSFGSVDGGQIIDNTIDTCYMTSLVNSYLIHLTRNKLQPIAEFPRTTNILVRGNLLKNNPTWEGVDTHAGTNLTIVDNTILNCYIGVAVVSSPDEANAENVYAPQNVLVSGNMIDSTVRDGTRRPGIQVVGAQGIGNVGDGAYQELAAGCRVIGNTILGHGTENTSNSGAIQIYFTQGCVVSNNSIGEGSPAGIMVWHDNYGAVITNNVITDTWTEGVSIACAIWIRDQFNDAHIMGNRVVRSTRSATHVNDRGIYIAQNTTVTTVKQSIGPNDLRGIATVANRVIDSSASSESQLLGNNIIIGSGSNQAFKLAFYGGTPVVRPDIDDTLGGTYTPGTEKMADAILNALVSLNLIRKI